jgi:imidazolonepropionase-like amidohydrolase
MAPLCQGDARGRCDDGARSGLVGLDFAGIAQCHQGRRDSGAAHVGGEQCHRCVGRPRGPGSDTAAAHRVAGPIQGVCNGPEECREAVRYQIKYGADVIKFMPSGGVLSLADPVDNVQLTQDEMNAIVSEAHAWSRKVAAHCHGDRGGEDGDRRGRGFDRARQLSCRTIRCSK